MTMLLVEVFVLLLVAFLAGCGAAAAVVSLRLPRSTTDVLVPGDRVTP